jgi:hypothetical protein
MSVFQNKNSRKTTGYSSWKLKSQKHVIFYRLSTARAGEGSWEIWYF